MQSLSQKYTLAEMRSKLLEWAEEKRMNQPQTAGDMTKEELNLIFNEPIPIKKGGTAR
jgi:hypothetical protein